MLKIIIILVVHISIYLSNLSLTAYGIRYIAVFGPSVMYIRSARYSPHPRSGARRQPANRGIREMNELQMIYYRTKRELLYSASFAFVRLACRSASPIVTTASSTGAVIGLS